MLQLFAMLKYLKCFNLPMERGKVLHVEFLKSKTRNNLNFDTQVFSKDSTLPPSAPFGNIMVLTTTDFEVNEFPIK